MIAISLFFIVVLLSVVVAMFWLLLGIIMVSLCSMTLWFDFYCFLLFIIKFANSKFLIIMDVAMLLIILIFIHFILILHQICSHSSAYVSDHDAYSPLLSFLLLYDSVIVAMILFISFRLPFVLFKLISQN